MSFTAFTESKSTDDFVHTICWGGTYLTITSDKSPTSSPLIRPTKTDAEARKAHAEAVANMQAGKTGEHDTIVVGDDDTA